ncbi:O-antigen ligase family protein [Aquitalea denitrificans]|uniref:O-antigen ligase family protein n=1 Tax=Aquitalea denitrificans TaxID=519081 RepID=UPI00135B26B0|nr:O-antigen ligase family protein [Aquitalea denitrificans]
MKVVANHNGWRDQAVLLLSWLFLTLANVSHTIALRYVILVLMLLIAIFGKLSFVRSLGNARAVVLALVVFLGYATMHTWLLSGWSQVSFHEEYSQLLIGGLWFLAGLWLFNRQRLLSIADLVILSGTALAVVEFGYGAYQYLKIGQWPFMETFTTATKLEFTFFMNYVLGFVAVAFCFSSFSCDRRITFFPRWALFILALLILFVSLRAGARNGMIGLIYLVLSMLFVFMVFEGFRFSWRKVLGISLLVFSTIIAIGIYTVRQDPRSHAFIESAQIGWNYPATKAWLRMEPLPKMSNGEPVDGSAYERIAWIHSGLDLIVTRPIGYGFSRDAFSLALTETGHHNQVGHSHSGFIDLGIGLGIPGVFLWLIFCGLLVRSGFQAFSQRREMLGLVLMLVTCGFMGRMVLESVNKDHMLHIFLFTAAALLAEIKQRQGISSGE